MIDFLAFVAVPLMIAVILIGRIWNRGPFHD